MSVSSPLDPPFPHDMHASIARATRDVQLQQFVGESSRIRDAGRITILAETFGDRVDELRRHAGRIKQHTLDHLDVYAERFVDRATAAGAVVHFAATADEANAICVRIAEEHGCRRCVKSKSMVTEETHLNTALQDAGLEVVETDLGEFIIQLDDDAPSHIVAPMIHKNRRSAGLAFERELGVPYTDDPSTLTRIAREHLREVYRHADMGITGGNFLAAETGSVVICTNEGNADLTMAVPRVHVAMVGIEKLVPDLAHAGVLLKLLAKSATAQPITVYTAVMTGPRRAEDRDGPEAFHIILIDNGRTELLAEESRELLRCIRCGACLNTCPVYRRVGGHSYGSVYPGPIGATITPLLRGVENYPHLPGASSLCGACKDACPVDIDLPRQLVRGRERLAARRLDSGPLRRTYRLWSWLTRHPRLYRRLSAIGHWWLRTRARDGWVESGPGPLRAWTGERDLPAPAETSFRDWWSRRGSSR